MEKIVLAVSSALTTVIVVLWYQENSPLENSHPENSYLSNFPTWRIHPRKIPTQKIPARNIPTNIFKHFVFPLLLPFSLIMVKKFYFCLLKILKLDLMRCIKKFLQLACYSGNVLDMIERFSIFSFRKCSTLVKSGRTKKKFLKNPKKLVKNLSACLKQLFYSIHVTTCFYPLHFLL